MKVLFVAGFGPVVEDSDASAAFYGDALGIDLGEGDYRSTESLDGVRHFGLWRLSDAAESCFGRPDWPEDVTRPQANIEFDVADVAAAAGELEGRGYRLLCGPKTEPWGQVVTRLLSPEGLLVGVTYTPAMR